VIACRKRNHEVIKMIGGRGFPVAALPGGMSYPISEEQRQEIIEVARQNVELLNSLSGSSTTSC
jgi:F420-non-reducing hydrogenase large subunit